MREPRGGELRLEPECEWAAPVYTIDNSPFLRARPVKGGLNFSSAAAFVAAALQFCTITD